MKTSILIKNITSLILFSMLTIIVKAQVIYTDINPDKLISCGSSPCSSTYSLDLNNDGIIDFLIMASLTKHGGGPYGNNYRTFSDVDVTPLNGNATFDIVNNSGDAIDEYLDWVTAHQTLATKTYAHHCVPRPPLGQCYWDGTVLAGTWNGQSDKYLPLKLLVGNNTYYGWAKLDVAFGGTSFTIKDYAYNSTPNQPILAGETRCTAPTVYLKARGPLSFYAGDSVTLTAKGTGYLYQWKKDGLNIKGAIAQMYIAKAAGIYNCKVTNSCGSKTSKADTVTIIQNAFSNALVNKFSPIYLEVAPNPFSNTTTISFSLPETERVSVNIFDITGRLMKTLVNAELQQGAHQVAWDAKDEKGKAVLTGIYFLKMQTANYADTKKLIVVK